MSADEFEVVIDRFLDIFGNGNPCLALNDVLFDDRHPLVARYLDNLREKPSKLAASYKSTWLDQHIQHVGDITTWMSRLSPIEDEDFVATFPGILALCGRQIDGVEAWNSIWMVSRLHGGRQVGTALAIVIYKLPPQ